MSNTSTSSKSASSAATSTTTKLVKTKVAQSIEILKELGIDCWVTFVRESGAGIDPVLPFIYGHEVTWQSAFILTANGDRIAILGRFDAENARKLGAYDEILTYDEAFGPLFAQTIARLDPDQIALNYSANDAHADGLGHGMYLLLQRYLAETPYAGRFVSAEEIIAKVRGVKTDAEIERIRAAIRTTEEIYQQTIDLMQPGMAEAELGTFMHKSLDDRGLTTSWERSSCPAVNSGRMPAGHAGPTQATMERGHLVHFDFGLCQDLYCSDIQRVVYLLKEGETAAPAPVQKGFDTIVKAIQAAVAAMKPGVLGHEVDTIARKVVTDAGYPSYKYATGHQVGRHAHDGGGTLAPLWERYGDTPKMALEAGQVYAVEPGLMVEGYGYLGLEENVLVTESGGIFLSDAETTLILK